MSIMDVHEEFDQWVTSLNYQWAILKGALLYLCFFGF
jgi:hypothetical protein